MIRQIVKKVSDNKFNVYWNKNDLIKYKLILDFNPIINYFNLSNIDSFLLLHWQARPKNLRRYGIFCRASKNYYCLDYDQLRIDANINLNLSNLELLQLDEANITTIPSAVILIKNCRVKKESNNKIWLISSKNIAKQS